MRIDRFFWINTLTNALMVTGVTIPVLIIIYLGITEILWRTQF